MKQLGLALLLCLLSSCALAPGKENSYQLYYVNDYDSTGQVLLPVTRFLPQSKDSILPLELVKAHLEYGWEPDVKTPFPQGLTVVSAEEVLPGVIDVMFSEDYADLTQMNRTVADYAVVQTLAQMPSVVGVRISVQGMEVDEYASVLREYDMLTLEEEIS